MEAINEAEKRMGITNVMLFLPVATDLTQELHQPEDWYTMKLTDLKDKGLTVPLNKLQLAQLLEEKYPTFKWDKVLLLQGRFAEQYRLTKAIASLFPVRNLYSPPPPPPSFSSSIC